MVIPPAAVFAGLFAIASAPALAGVYAVAGSRQHVNIINPPGTGRCALIPRTPPYAATVDIIPGPGIPSSSGVEDRFGDFAGTMSHCIVTPPPTLVEEGIFSWAFADGDLLEGVYTGSVSTTATPDLFNATIDYVVTGGTGRFFGASGTIFEEGSFLRGPNPGGPGFITEWEGSFSGLLDLPAVPEPATWTLAIAGFGLVGGVLRRQRRAHGARAG
jgi:hypothetical protein